MAEYIAKINGEKLKRKDILTIGDTTLEVGEEIVRCKDCKWYDPPHIEYKDGTREDYPKEPFVTFDIGTTVGGMCKAKNGVYCTAHDREDPDDYEEIVVFRNPDDYCSFGEREQVSDDE